jgi:3',5'-cyclic AMP phosphodiesterase CpdA
VAQIGQAERLLADLGRAGLCRIVLIHHPPLTTESRFKRLTDAAAFQAMIRRVGCELVLHGHNHRSEVARIAGPTGPVPVIGVTSASAAAGSKYGRARYHLLHIGRASSGWNLGVDIRALRADGAGCEPDGRLMFCSGVTGDVLG